MARFQGHPIEDAIVILIGGLYFVSLLTKASWLVTLGGIMFMIFLPTFLFGRKVEIRGDRIVLKFECPPFFPKIEVSPGDIVEIIDLEQAEEVPPIKYYKKALGFTLLWLLVGFTGLIEKPEWAFVWAGWIYWGIIGFLTLIFPKKLRKQGAIVLLSFSVIVSYVLYLLNVSLYPFYIFLGFILVLSYLTDLREKAIILVTEKGTYFIYSIDYKKLVELLKTIGRLSSGGPNVQTA
ncbi:hypothetical protein [Thermococcus sp.]|uniref:hypothetical protein n=1 Tax=Thermococcus sp. TaxID=35749 RepID=UPI0025D83142|nr:hypothetical protein [Thermococcus sp.]